MDGADLPNQRGPGRGVGSLLEAAHPSVGSLLEAAHALARRKGSRPGCNCSNAEPKGTKCNQAHSVLGERPAYVGVNGWHDPGRSDGLSNWRILLRDVVKRWTMQDTNDFFGGIRFFTLVLRGQLIVHILSFYVIVTGAGWGKA